MAYELLGAEQVCNQTDMKCEQTMKRFVKISLLFIASFTFGAVVVQLFMIEVNTINEPDSKSVQHDKDRNSDSIRRIV